jgi:DNA-binding NarL/FixJ family response regulator
MIRVVIADDEALVRGGFRMILEAQDDIEVVGEAADGAEAVEQVVKLRPDVALMDVRMPRMDGIEGTRRIVKQAESTHILMLTTFNLDEYVYEAMRAGASGFLLKDAPPVELARAVRVVAGGETLLAPSITKNLVEQFVRRPPPGGRVLPELESLTARELEVLKLVARGLSNSEVARSLYVSEATAKTHVTRILSKLNLRDRVQAVVMAYESGLIRPGEESRTST